MSKSILTVTVCIGQALDMFYNFFYFLIFHFSLIWYTNLLIFSAWLDLDFEFDGFGSKVKVDTEKFENFRKNKNLRQKIRDPPCVSTKSENI